MSTYLTQYLAVVQERRLEEESWVRRGQHRRTRRRRRDGRSNRGRSVAG